MTSTWPFSAKQQTDPYAHRPAHARTSALLSRVARSSLFRYSSTAACSRWLGGSLSMSLVPK
jgi:hypothetical protein